LSNETGANNTAIGVRTGQNSTGSSNVCIGSQVFGVAGENNTIRIGDNLPPQTEESACYIGGIYNQAVPGGFSVLVDSSGKLGTTVSPRRFKEDVKAMDKASEVIFALKPVTFRYKQAIDPARVQQFPLVPWDVEKINPDLVVHDKAGKPYSVLYDHVNAMVLNEFLKEHKTVEAQQATIAELKQTVAQQQKRFGEQEKEIAALISGLQKVSAQLEFSRPAPHTVANQP